MLGERLIKLRKSRKLTQQQVADKLHLSRGTYAQYEIDRRVPEYAKLEKLADFFEVSIDYLVGRDRKENQTTAEKELEEEQNYVAGLFEKITDPVKKQAAIEVLKGLAGGK